MNAANGESITKAFLIIFARADSSNAWRTMPSYTAPVRSQTEAEAPN